MQKEFEFSSPDDFQSESNAPQLILILDTETSGLDPSKDQCIEVGAILFHVESRCVLSQVSFLMPVMDNSAEAINKIPPAITQLNQSWEKGLEYFNSLVDRSDVILAHNASFDRQWFGNGLLPKLSKQWICSMEDIPWPSELLLKGRPSVKDLALAYEVPVWSAHRALTDCIYLVEVLRRCSDLETLLIHGLEPRKLMKAEVSYDERQLAKNAGFRWNEPVRGAWTRRLSEREIRNLAFPVTTVEF
ncbi:MULTISPECIES: 3'-5' exonuclease [unclassified Prochlorococcus]|uniref:3'-5' exonuclease n=1 Tax=unclassified Prochlorococcus TaxID=2627481 RepID=UPI0005339B24|nr:MULTISPECIES: 3'-5' exonuclease [unclassified Prochlorococcus]KGG15092.1 putative DNA polymerasee III [Prochlorococcus sp. MIT 0602]KGG17364.1 putative DNA polymerasee III [Prochlorococcus sp. MIT 0603]